MNYRNRRGRPSLREMAERINAAHNYVASLTQDPQKAKEYRDSFVKELPPKRERVRRPVDGKPIHASEHQEQAAVISWWRLQHQRYALPEFALFAVPNGGARDAITGALLKAEGVRPGALDLILAKPKGSYHGLFIEMKVGNNKPSFNQHEFLNYLEAVGYKATVHWNAATAIREIEEYLAC